jgi:hypothetical protein
LNGTLLNVEKLGNTLGQFFGRTPNSTREKMKPDATTDPDSSGACAGSASRILDLARQPGTPLEQWQDQAAADRERKRLLSDGCREVVIDKLNGNLRRCLNRAVIAMPAGCLCVMHARRAGYLPNH